MITVVVDRLRHNVDYMKAGGASFDDIIEYLTSIEALANTLYELLAIKQAARFLARSYPPGMGSVLSGVASNLAKQIDTFDTEHDMV